MKPSGTHRQPTRSASVSTLKEGRLFAGPKVGPRRCEVRSGTDSPCPRPASVEILGLRFCERCAREQEAYFALGESTWTPKDGGPRRMLKFPEPDHRVLATVRVR